jgi:predicted membrane chloride channel (bestrophin family)
MWVRFRRKEPDIGALQKALGRFRRGTRATRRQDVVAVPGSTAQLGFIVLLTLLLAIALALRLRRRRRTREEEATFTSPPPEEVLEEAERHIEDL